MTFTGAVLAWITQRLSSVNKVPDKLDRARNAIDTKVQAAKKKRRDEIEATTERCAMPSPRSRQRRARSRTRNKPLPTRRKSCSSSAPAAGLARFIDTRATSNDYRQHLGVLAAVRHDLSMLSQLMYPADEDEEPELDEYLTSSAARYEIVLSLLAIVVGAPDVSLEAFAEIKQAVSANGTLEAFVNDVIKRGDEWERVANALAALGGNQPLLGTIANRIDDVARYSFRPPYAQLAKKKNGATTETTAPKLSAQQLKAEHQVRA